ncbi:MAG: YeeE/YedE family protein [Burkholderiales bacterium]|nr:YeeE/YedE family protein [Burkholderiales bacterium]
MLPLSSYHEFSTIAYLAIAVALGFGFGFCLERAGFGSARKLTAVFYLYDMAVVKVMFTAIVTAMAGIFVLSTAGWLDVREFYVEPTNLAAQAIGGLVFGAGFIVGGYCPGTSVAAMATGRKDGYVFALGMLAGVLVYSELTPDIDAWVRDTAQGEMTLPSVTGIGTGVWTMVFIAVLAFAAWGMGRLESRFAGLRPRGS